MIKHLVISGGSYNGIKLYGALHELAKKQFYNINNIESIYCTSVGSLIGTMLSLKIENSRVLDLFSGVGSFGLECFSRSSSFIYFIENYKEVLPILKRNISNIGCQDTSEVIEKNILNFNFTIFKKKSFDIIFLILHTKKIIYFL